MFTHQPPYPSMFTHQSILLSNVLYRVVMRSVYSSIEGLGIRLGRVWFDLVWVVVT